MRTTVTLDPDVETLIQTVMREKGLSFKQAINAAIRAGLAPGLATAFRQRSFSIRGLSGVSISASEFL